MTLAARLRTLISRTGRPDAEIARRAGMTRQQLHALVSKGNANPQIDTLRRVVAACGGSLAELFADEDGRGHGERPSP